MILVTIFLCVVASISAYREKKRKRPGFYNFTDNDSFDMMEEQPGNENSSGDEGETLFHRSLSQQMRNTTFRESKL